MKKYVCEFIGTAVLVLFGCGSAAIAGAALGTLGIALAFGLSFVAMAYVIGNVTGCHINPAVSLAMFINKKISIHIIKLTSLLVIFILIFYFNFLVQVLSGKFNFNISAYPCAWSGRPMAVYASVRRYRASGVMAVSWASRTTVCNWFIALGQFSTRMSLRAEYITLPAI